MREFLDTHGEGIHHLAFDCHGALWNQRIANFWARGFGVTQSGRWLDRNSFSFFDTEAATTTPHRRQIEAATRPGVDPLRRTSSDWR